MTHFSSFHPTSTGCGAYVEAGFDDVVLNPIGPDQEPFFGFFEKELGPRLRELARERSA